MVTPATVRALVIVFAPHDTDARHLDHVVATTAERMAAFTGARPSSFQKLI
jgi:DNA/RNA-binding domain of Phe-tRNA-synthetase-like protein